MRKASCRGHKNCSSLKYANVCFQSLRTQQMNVEKSKSLHPLPHPTQSHPMTYTPGFLGQGALGICVITMHCTNRTISSQHGCWTLKGPSLTCPAACHCSQLSANASPWEGSPCLSPPSPFCVTPLCYFCSWHSPCLCFPPLSDLLTDNDSSL